MALIQDRAPDSKSAGRDDLIQDRAPDSESAGRGDLIQDRGVRFRIGLIQDRAQHIYVCPICWNRFRKVLSQMGIKNFHGVNQRRPKIPKIKKTEEKFRKIFSFSKGTTPFGRFSWIANRIQHKKIFIDYKLNGLSENFVAK